MNDDTTHKNSTDDQLAPAGNWSVWRQGDDGNRFLIEAGLSEDVAKHKVAEFESHGHKQLYWATSQQSECGS